MENIIDAWRAVVAPHTVLSIIHFYDYDTTLDDYYGTFTDSVPDGFYVDRKHGRLHGPRKEWTEDFPTEEARDTRWEELEDLGYGVDEVFTAITVKLDEVDAGGNPDREERSFADDEEYAYGDYLMELRRAYGWNYNATEERAVWRIEVAGDEVLADDLSTRDDDRTYRYQSFSDIYGHVPTEPWDSLTEEQKQEYIGYMKNVYTRSVEYFRNWWGYIGISVEVHWKGEQIAGASIWGIDSDMDDADFSQYERELIDEALSGAVNHFVNESKHYGVQIDAPAELVKLDTLSIDELVPLWGKVRASEGPWHPSYRGRTLYSDSYRNSFEVFFDNLGEEDQALYKGETNVDES